MSGQQRQHFLAGLQEAMAGLSSQGIEVLTLSVTEPHIDQASSHHFMGVWRFPDQRACQALLAGIQASGWYEYFDHINAAGAQGEFAQHLLDLANV
ncbi:hypothetical protein MJ863_09135 [Alcaligenes ammonioxydans]|uniref:Uncharacterized protein n=2 Tax=Alcaligenes TaxID=507 RepID=A0ABX8SZU2_9BURK|nr:DUF6616 family protein [Alcaligenes ammonioxydans]EJC61016.1 hypothetical protein QWA_16983 [Alcaligenes faecalis subsp. faecalis NCIB 8687]QBH19347.1 hypothetical protein EYC51_07525 [Alcaligenes faecalis]MCH1879743.1 hypothetical protein [Alcaligenes ammonioxydans]QXX80408.1 hypothetical protein FE795_16200 [Alcaligenes ammonioxydans]WGQ35386.1 hypothetical protein QEZ63_16180 [Alcaligenes faecalis]